MVARSLLVALGLLAFCVVTEAYKIAVFAPDISGSQLIFNKKVAETLARGGHDVTIYRIRSMGYRHVEVQMDQRIVKVSDVIAYADEDFDEFRSQQGEIFFTELSFFDSKKREAYAKFMRVFINSCSELLQMKSFMEAVKEAQFDLAFASSYDYCSVGIIHAAGIPTWVWLNSGPLTEMVANDVGVPGPPSYVPMVMGQYGDRMTFLQRLANLVMRTLYPFMMKRTLETPQTELFRKHVRPNFPDLQAIARECPLVMVNSHDFYDFARPTLGKIVNIGGLGMRKPENLSFDEPVRGLVEKADTVVLFSLGTVAVSSQMPAAWKKAIMGAFARFPEVQFLVRYPQSDLDAVAPPNVHLAEWLPQHELLHHPKVKLFITHGGYNSYQEAIHAAKPVIVIPLFGDQQRNAILAVEHGFGVKLDKKDITESKLHETIHNVLTNPEYTQNVSRLSDQVAHAPFTAEETLLKWTAFLAKFKTLDQMKPAGNDLSFIQYHNLDIFAIFGTLLFLLLFGLFKLLSCVTRLFLGDSEKLKHE